MAEFDERIAKLTDPGTQEQAIRDLAAGGPGAIPEIADAIRSLKGPPQLLASVLQNVREKGAAEAFTALLRDDDTMVQLASIEALGYVGDEQAARELEAFLREPDQLPVPKGLAAEALGNMGRKEAMSLLAETMAAAEKEKEPELAIRCAVALANLGDFRGYPIVIRGAQAKSKPMVRLAAVGALTLVAGNDMFQVLKGALRDKNVEVRRAAIEAVYYLGSLDAAEALVGSAGDKDHTAANNAVVYLHRITGDELDEETPEIRRWWMKRREAFQTDVSYRLGVPVTPTAIAEIADDPKARFDAAREFSIYTGRHFGSDAYVRLHLEEISREISRLGREMGPHFEPGVVYKAAVRFDLPALIGKS